LTIKIECPKINSKLTNVLQFPYRSTNSEYMF